MKRVQTVDCTGWSRQRILADYIKWLDAINEEAIARTEVLQRQFEATDEEIAAEMERLQAGWNKDILKSIAEFDATLDRDFGPFQST